MVLAVANNLLGNSHKSTNYWMKMLARMGVNEEEAGVQFAIESLSYLMLHMSKVNANETSFETIFDQTGLKTEFKGAFFLAITPKLPDLRDLLNVENQVGSVRYKDFDWRLGMVTGCRQH